MADNVLEWIRVVGPIVVSWPAIGLIAVLLFRKPLLGVIERFSQSQEGEAELGPLKIKLGAPVLPPQYSKAPTEQRSETIDLSDTIGRIGDQGPEGTVVGFTVAYAMQSAIKIGRGEEIVLSPRSIYVAARKASKLPKDVDTGATLVAALNAVKKTGAYLESEWPYSSKTGPAAGTKPAYRISSYQPLDGIAAILSALRADKVVLVGLIVTEDFLSPDASKTGKIVARLPLKVVGGHSVCLVGYDEKEAEFKFANSWGKQWGKQGFGFIRDSDLSKLLGEAYTVTV